MTDYHVFSRHTDIIIGQREAWYEQLKGDFASMKEGIVSLHTGQFYTTSI